MEINNFEKIKIMLKLLFFLCFFVGIIHADFAKWGIKKKFFAGFTPKTYSINLDLPYKERWNELITENKKEILDIIKLSLELYGPLVTQTIPYNILQGYNTELAQEMQAISDILEVPIAHVFLLNVMYEAYSYCTSVIVQDSTNSIFHSRNLDYGITDPIAKVSFLGKFYKNGKTFYKAQILAGFISFSAVEKSGKFAISANQRESKPIGEKERWEEILGRSVNLFEVFYNKRVGMLFVIKQVIEKAETYQEAVEMLEKGLLASPVYYIVSGVHNNEGSILTMSRDGLIHKENLNTEKGIWYLVQTNYDRDFPDPVIDDRRSVAEQRIQLIGRNKMTQDKLLNEVMMVYPNFNAITIASIVFSAKEDYFNIIVWN